MVATMKFPFHLDVSDRKLGRRARARAWSDAPYRTAPAAERSNTNMQVTFGQIGPDRRPADSSCGSPARIRATPRPTSSLQLQLYSASTCMRAHARRARAPNMHMHAILKPSEGTSAGRMPQARTSPEPLANRASRTKEVGARHLPHLKARTLIQAVHFMLHRLRRRVVP